MQFKQAKLDNGLTVIAEVNPAAATMAAGFFVRTGSRDERAGIEGVSHFLEHMVFKGTARRSALEVNRDFDEMGANYNAFTSEENTVYFGSVLPEFQERLIDLLGDILRPSLRQEDFDIEKNVILEEIAMYQDMPRYRLYDQLMSRHFAGHPLGQSVLGTPASITDLKRDQMQEYFDRRYSPTNVTVAAVGRLEFDALVSQVSKACLHWKPFDAPRALPPAGAVRKQELIVDAKVNRQHIGFMSPAPASQDDDRYAATLAASVLGDSTGSRLYYALVDGAIADEASVGYDPLDGAGVFTTFVSCDVDKAASAMAIVREEFVRFLASGPTPAEMTAAKNKIASSATLKGELPMGRLTAVGFDWTYRHEYVPLSQQIDKLFAVTPEQVVEVARRHDLLAATILGLGPMEKLTA